MVGAQEKEGDVTHSSKLPTFVRKKIRPNAHILFEFQLQHMKRAGSYNRRSIFLLELAPHIHRVSRCATEIPCWILSLGCKMTRSPALRPDNTSADRLLRCPMVICLTCARPSSTA